MADYKKGKKRLLLAGGLSSIHIYNLTKNVLSFTDYDIVAYHTTGDLASIPTSYLELYNRLNIKIVQGRNVAKVGIFRYVWGLYNDFKKLGGFDIVNLHYVSHYIAPILFLNRNKYRNIILTFWGSDLLRSTFFKRMVTKPILKKASSVQVMTEGMKESLMKIYKLRFLLDKIRVLDFGDMFLDGIDNVRSCSESSIKNIKNDFGFDTDLPIVTIGYVGRPEMQQIKAVEGIIDNSMLQKTAFQLALPVYGMNDNSINELHNLLKNSGIKYKIFPEFMQEENVVNFRAITDVFIHPQTTDALSCSVVECFYSGSIVINGSWLNYRALEKENAYYYKFSSFPELGNILSTVISNLDYEKSRSITNIAIIKKMIHWDTLRSQWIEMYKENE